MFCDFAISFDESFREQFIWGVKDSNIKRRISSEGTINFKEYVELGHAIKSAMTS